MLLNVQVLAIERDSASNHDRSILVLTYGGANSSLFAFSFNVACI